MKPLRKHVQVYGKERVKFGVILFSITFLFLLSSPSLALAWKFFTFQESFPPIRAAQVDLDYVFDEDKKQQKENIKILVSRVKDLGINTVFLQAFADSDGQGIARTLYFPNSALPLKEDLFKPVCEELRNNGVAVYGWLPILSFYVKDEPSNIYIQQVPRPERNSAKKQQDSRLSPYHEQAQKIITTIYADLANTTVLDGILFHDDGRLTDREDNSEAALEYYRILGFPDDIDTIRGDQALLRKWSRSKTVHLISFTKKLIQTVKQQQPWVRSARNIFASPVLNPESEIWFAQSLPLFLDAYDYTAILAMPFMEKAKDPKRWLEQLVWSALRGNYNPNKIIFELQTKNWLTGKPIPAASMKNHLLILARLGATSLAYYPDDFYKNNPPAKLIRSCFASPEPCSSIRTY